MGLDDFDFEPSSAEPEEWDPEADLYDPEADGVTIPQVSTNPSEVDPEISRAFWTIVLVVNAALLFVSLGPMLWFFLGWARGGITLVLGGIALFGLAYFRYRRFMANAPDRDDTDELEETAPEQPDGPSQQDKTSQSDVPSDGGALPTAERDSAEASPTEASDEPTADESTHAGANTDRE